MTADTFSNTLGYLIMGTGNDNNTWGSNANSAVFQVFEDAIANMLTSAVTGGTLDLSGSPPPAAASQARYSAFTFTGVLGSNQIIQVPNLPKMWLVRNSCTGAFTLKFKTPAGAAIGVVPANSGWQLVHCDGANTVVVEPFNSLQVQMLDGTTGAPSYSWLNETNSGWRRAGAQDYRLVLGGTDVLQITGAGAGTPSIFNVLSPNALQINGAQVIPAGSEQAGAFIELPSGWLWEDGSAYDRVVRAALFAAITKAATGTTNSNTVITSTSVDLRFKGLLGAFIEGTGIPLGTTITAITSSTITMSAAAVSSGAGVALRILPFGQGDGSTTFNVPDRRERVLFGRGDMNSSSSPGRITAYDATKLNAAIGTENFTLGQANLPALNFPVSGITLNDPGHSHSLNNATSIYRNTGGVAIAGPSPNPMTPVDITVNAATTGITIATQGSAASGGSGTAVYKLDPGGVTNWIIKL